MPDAAKNARDIVSKPSIIDDYKAPFLFVYDLTFDGSGDNTAKVINILYKQGWVPILMTSTPPAKGSLGASYIYTTLRRMEKPKRPPTE